MDMSSVLPVSDTLPREVHTERRRMFSFLNILERKSLFCYFTIRKMLSSDIYCTLQGKLLYCKS
jgi:hypothetical protein